MFPLLLLALAAAPALPPELAKCDLWKTVDARSAGYCDDCLKIESVDVDSERLIRVRTVNGGIGVNKQREWSWWMVHVESCRTVGVALVSGAGSPVMRAAFLHATGNSPPTSAEQDLLRSWSGFAAFDPANPHDQLAAAALSSLNTAEGSQGRNELTAHLPKPLSLISASTPVPLLWTLSNSVSQRISWRLVDEAPAMDLGSNATCPCYAIFNGEMFRPTGKLTELAGMQVQRFATQERDETDAVMVSAPGRGSAWLEPLSGYVSILGSQHGLVWLRVPIFMSEGAANLIAIDPANGSYRWLRLGGIPVDVTSVGEKGIEIRDLYEDRRIQIRWKVLDEVLRR